jgi:hypothetical protein
MYRMIMLMLVTVFTLADVTVLAEEASAPNPPEITVLSPLPYQVFQRETHLQGTMLVSGRINVPCDRLEVRVIGSSLKGKLPGRWQFLPVTVQTGRFHAALALPAGGWYQVELRSRNGKQVHAQTTVDHVGIGEVFVGAGQSNSTNCGQERIQQTSGMVSSFSGSAWQLADDPQPGPHDRSTGGSFWPAFGDAMYAQYRVPIGVAVTGHGGTSINQWQPGGELFNWMMTRIFQLGPGGFRAVLWHQGESDVAMPSSEYAEKLCRVILASKAAARWEFPWFVAQVSYHNPEKPSFASTRDAQQLLWKQGIALEGPDTDTLIGDHRDYHGQGIHFSPKGLRAHGVMWAEKVSTYLHQVLK